ncbi:MAG: hypothetical protein M3290_04950 [Actinomycetota bacterium]|nr:hypothetical protein [Actinomycetota bacterium]
MEVSLRTKAILLTGALVLVFAYVVVVDVGVSAGRIHHGVKVDSIDVGGMTYPEAIDALAGRADQLATAPVVLYRGPIQLKLYPYEVGFRPKPALTALAAMRVGRDHAPFGAIGDRIHAWFGGVKVRWQPGTNTRKLGKLVSRYQEDLSRRGLTMSDSDRKKLRYKIRVALNNWPRRPIRIPGTL